MERQRSNQERVTSNEQRGISHYALRVTRSKDIPLVVILGPTASGKSDLAIQLAKKFNGEIVSADSRQVYRGLDIGTGKVTKREQRIVRHHLLDVASPGSRVTVARYKKLADAAIRDIWKRGKLPFLVGGSPLYTKAVSEGYEVPSVKPDWKLRKQLEAQPIKNLLVLLKKFDKKTFDRIDKKNPRRIIRALEIIYHTGKPIPALEKTSPYAVLMLGIDIPRNELYKRIDSRVDACAKRGMIREVERLIEEGVSRKWLKSLGLEYRFITEFLEELRRFKIQDSRFPAKPDPALPDKFHERREMLERLKFAIHDFARRQLIWYRAMSSILWIKSTREAERAIRRFV